MKILIIEDDSSIASFVSDGLTRRGFVCHQASDGNEALALAMRGNYDCLVLDIMLPGLSGLELLRVLRGQGHRMPVIILSARSELDHRLQGFAAGADDYLTKPFSYAELEARVLALIRRGSAAGLNGEDQVLTCGPISLNRLKHQASVHGAVVELPSREFALLEYLLRNQGNVVSKTMILEQIWDYHFDPQTNVVDVLVHRLRGKVDPDHRFIHTIRGVGYVLKEA